MSDAIRDEIKRLTGRGGAGYCNVVSVSEPHRVRGCGGASPLACTFCFSVISGMCGPSPDGTVCQLCAQAIRDPSHPLGELLRDAWVNALRGAFRE